MKKYLLSFLLLTISLSAYSQAPEGFNYHAILSDNLGNPLINQAVSFRFTIIQESPLGADVFQETHNVTTDDFGAVSLIINNGTSKVGVFETIDWSTDSYFLKVELDKNGGTSYTNMGTSQLLSVPYALHAKTAANGFSGNFNDLINKPVTDGSETKVDAGSSMIITGSGTIVDPYIIINDGFSGDYNDLINKPITDGSESRITAGVNITITGAGTVTSPYVINSKSHIAADANIIVTGSGTSADPYIIKERVHYVGESFGGGIVFYVYNNGRHGLIAATNDQDVSVEWYNGLNRYTNTTGNGVGAGEMNTSLIISLQTNDNPVGNFAAKVCADYSVTVNGENYGDWYLPSKLELAYLFMKKEIVGGFLNNYYWSSTEFSSISAWSLSMTDGTIYNLKKSTPYAVRAIRAF
jgi:DNA/RNA endonuclease YhcR with UshA esterase domain